MNRETVIALAREAGWQYADGDDGYNPLWRFAALVAAHEREGCAKVCEERKTSPAVWMIDKSYNQAVEHCAAAIRNRSN